MTDHDISELLDRLGERTTVSEPPTAVMLADAARLRRRRTTWVASLAAASVAVVLGGVALSTAGQDDGSGGREETPLTTSPSPSPTPVPEGMRLVGIGTIGIAVPEEWGTNRTRCGTPEHDTVVIDQGVVCAALFPRPDDVESIELSEGRRFEFEEDGATTTAFEQNGLTGQRIATTCGRGGIWGAGSCRSLVYLPAHDVTFIAESSSRDGREQVEAMLGWIQPLPAGQVAVRGITDVRYYGPDRQKDAGTRYGELLQELGLRASYVEESRAAMTPGFILGVDPAPGTVVPLGTQVTVTVVGEPEGPADEISLGMNSARADGSQGPVSLLDGEIKGNPDVRLRVGDHLWLYAHGARSKTLAGELEGDALVLDDWKEGPNYGRSWIADRPGTSTITVTIQVNGERFVLGTVTVHVR